MAKKYNPKQRWAVKRQWEEKLAREYPDLKPESGIYMFYRIVAYIGKSAEKNGILGRCASHCMSHDQHIDNSIYSRKLSCDGGQWFIEPLIYCSPDEVDKYEQEFIEEYKNVYELYNVESGGTDGKTIIGERKSPKTYREGLAQGRKNAIKEIAKLFDKNLTFSINGKENKNKEKALAKFEAILQENSEKDSENS